MPFVATPYTWWLRCYVYIYDFQFIELFDLLLAYKYIFWWPMSSLKSPCHHLFEINEEKCLILKALYQPLLLVIVQTFKKKLHKKNRHIMTLFSFRSGQRDRQKHFSHFPITVSFINAKDEIYYGNKTLWQFEINRNTFSHQKWTHNRIKMKTFSMWKRKTRI